MAIKHMEKAVDVDGYETWQQLAVKKLRDALEPVVKCKRVRTADGLCLLPETPLTDEQLDTLGFKRVPKVFGDRYMKGKGPTQLRFAVHRSKSGKVYYEPF